MNSLPLCFDVNAFKLVFSIRINCIASISVYFRGALYLNKSKKIQVMKKINLSPRFSTTLSGFLCAKCEHRIDFARFNKASGKESF